MRRTFIFLKKPNISSEKQEIKIFILIRNSIQKLKIENKIILFNKETKKVDFKYFLQVVWK